MGGGCVTLDINLSLIVNSFPHGDFCEFYCLYHYNCLAHRKLFFALLLTNYFQTSWKPNGNAFAIENAKQYCAKSQIKNCRSRRNPQTICSIEKDARYAPKPKLRNEEQRIQHGITVKRRLVPSVKHEAILVIRRHANGKRV